MRIGLCGGTFDPLHNGHVALIRAALTSGYVDRILVMPSGKPPHKSMALVSMARYRYEMAVRAFAGDDRIKVSDLEIVHPGPSYTLNTIQQLRAMMPPDDELYLIYGSDVLKDIGHWHEPAAILAACPLLLADRGGYPDQMSRSLAEKLTTTYGARIRFFPAPSIKLSGTRIRAAAAAGEPLTEWVPETVERLIRKHGIYSWQSDLETLDPVYRSYLQDLEQQLWPLLTGKRLLHSLNVMNYALHLARLHHAPLEDTGTAALLHDCAKCLPVNEQLGLARRTGDEALLDPALAHGPAGAWMARNQFGIDNPVILNAIHYHTTGCARMSLVDKIIFIADKVEPARTYEHLAQIRRLAEYDLDRSLLICMQEIGSFLDRENLPRHPYTQDALNDLNKAKT
ncbi:MAG: nicotinate-nucleotide adenylyltransferase [Clostridiaceae bacterium]|nr:nicotinate-nucleotide adenylyltransferase [Clostridiaceae bacterium]